MCALPLFPIALPALLAPRDFFSPASDDEDTLPTPADVFLHDPPHVPRHALSLDTRRCAPAPSLVSPCTRSYSPAPAPRRLLVEQPTRSVTSPVRFDTSIWDAPLFSAPPPPAAAPPPIVLPSLLLQLDTAPAYPTDADGDIELAFDDDYAAYTESGPPSPCPSSPDESHFPYELAGRAYAPHFPVGHALNPYFVGAWELGDELGAGGYGFVMTARHRGDGVEAAVKFIVKDKVPAHMWIEDEVFGRVPTEVMLVSVVDHDGIVKCLDVFEDELYFYLVQELHGTPWIAKKKRAAPPPPMRALPTLSKSSSCSTLNGDSAPHTPAQGLFPALPFPLIASADVDMAGAPLDAKPFEQVVQKLEAAPVPLPIPTPALAPSRPNFTRRASHDLFECIEQSKHKRLSEAQAQYIFAQVVDSVFYLESQGITHRDIKDENLVIDKDLTVKLIDFGSAVVSDPNEPRPYYKLFYGTTAYASPEILLRRPYQAPPAEMWTLGVLLAYLLTGHSPFPTERDAIMGRIALKESAHAEDRPSEDVLDVMRMCLEVDTRARARISEVRAHPWVRAAMRPVV